MGQSWWKMMPSKQNNFQHLRIWYYSKHSSTLERNCNFVFWASLHAAFVHVANQGLGRGELSSRPNLWSRNDLQPILGWSSLLKKVVQSHFEAFAIIFYPFNVIKGKPCLPGRWPNPWLFFRRSFITNCVCFHSSWNKLRFPKIEWGNQKVVPNFFQRLVFSPVAEFPVTLRTMKAKFQI